MKTRLITLTTDFGLKDGFVGTMKGVILGICPRAALVDISHEIGPQNILEGAWVLSRAYAYFPAGTVHLAVVDPGVGTERRPLAARLGDQFFVGPDNGLFTPILEAVEKEGRPVSFVHLQETRFWLPEVSRTFHGRDIFAPVAAHLANGVPLARFGSVIVDPVRLALPRPEKTAQGWRAHIVSIDHFGNLATDLVAVEIPDPNHVRLTLYGREIRGLVSSYGQKPSNELVALQDSENRLEVAVVGSSAASLLGARVGDVVDVSLS